MYGCNISGLAFVWGMLVRSKNRWLYWDVTRQTKNCSVWSAFESILPLWWWPAHLSRDNSGGSATGPLLTSGPSAVQKLHDSERQTFLDNLWQNHLNYPGSSALAIIIRQYRLKRTSNRTIISLSGNVPIQPPVLGSNKHTPHEGESRDITTIHILQHKHSIYYNKFQSTYYRSKLSNTLNKP